MNSSNLDMSQVRRTTADELFDRLRSDIEKLRLLPGTKLSESDVARRYNVSRQPVREALIRLDNLDLVEIQPQKATIVRRMSKSSIEQARFVRLAVELEISRRACERYDGTRDQAFQNLLSEQDRCLELSDIPGFNSLDHDFHAMLCSAADCDYAVEIIEQCKAKVDRLCLLSLTDAHGAKQVFEDHARIVECLINRDEAGLCDAIRKHLSRLDTTIVHVQQHHGDYFDD